MNNLTNRAIFQDALFKQALKISTAGVIGVGLWGIVTGLAIVKSGLSVWHAIGMTLLVYSGTAQLAALPLIALGTPLLAIVTTAILVSLRFVVYSAIIAKYFGHFSFFKRVAIGYLTIDSGLAVYVSHFKSTWTTEQQLAFWAGSNLPVWATWQVGSMIGIGLAGFLPDSKAYAFIGLLAIFALITPLLKSKAAVLCALAATVVAVFSAVFGQHWPTGVGTLAAVAVGVSVAMLFEEKPQ
jgi:predicted branched-subunit amino acid permease